MTKRKARGWGEVMWGETSKMYAKFLAGTYETKGLVRRARN
jgi:hypothetical protein